MKKLYIYTRVSTEKQSELGYSLESQRKAGIIKAKQLSVDFLVFEDAGLSASSESIESRPMLKKLMALCDEGKVTDIFVTEWDRLTRNAYTDLYIRQVLKDNNITVHTTSSTINLTDDDTELMVDIQAAFARRENKLRAKRSKRGLYERALKGGWNGPVVPLGYRKNKDRLLEVDEEGKSIYLRIVDLSLAGHGTNYIAKVLNDEGIPTTASKIFTDGIKHTDSSGKKTITPANELVWKDGTIFDILKNPIYNGQRRYKGNFIPAPAIISEEVWNKVQQNLQKNKNNPTTYRKHFYLLKGLLRCSRCGNTIYGLIKENKGMRLYQCLSKRPNPYPRFCGMKNINIDKLNNLVWESTVNLVYHSDIIRKHYQESVPKINHKNIAGDILILKKSIAETEGKMDRVLKLYEDGDLERAKYLERIKIHQEKINELQTSIHKLELELSSEKRTQSIFKWLNGYFEEIHRVKNLKSEIDKQAILRAFIATIEINYMDDINEHVVEINYKFPVYDDGSNIAFYTADGLDLKDGINVIEDYDFRNIPELQKKRIA